MSNAVSPLRMLDWRIADFNASNNVINPAVDIPHAWTVNAHIEHLEAAENLLHAAVYVRFSFLAEQGETKIQLGGTAAAFFSFDKENTDSDDPQALFDQLLRGAAMTNMFGNLRVFLLQAGALLQLGSKRVMFPFINLNEFRFDEDFTFNV